MRNKRKSKKPESILIYIFGIMIPFSNKVAHYWTSEPTDYVHKIGKGAVG